MTTDTLKGTTPHSIIIDEMAQVDESVFEWARSLPRQKSDERLCPWSPNMQHHYFATPDPVTGYAAMGWTCAHCGEPDR